MKGIHKLAMLAALGLVGPLLAPASRAADAAPSDDALTTIVVTAEKREEKIKDVPMSITALGGGSLDNLQYRSFSDYAAMVPGLSLSSSQPGYTNLTLRGQNAGGVGSTVAVYLDESPFGSSSALLNGSILSGDFDTWDLQRVEVLRGPQGTLYGANSEGGLLKFVTAPPVLGVFSGAAEVTGEVVDHGSTGGDLRAVVNLPLGDNMALRVGGFKQDVAGFVDDVSRNKTDINGGEKYGGRVSLLAKPIDSLTIRLTASSQQSRYNGTPQVDIDPVTLRPSEGDLQQQRIIDQPSTFEYKNYNATINWDAGPFSILSTTSYGILNSDAITDDTNGQLAPGLTLQDFAALVLGLPNTGGYLDNLVDLKKFTQEVRVSSPTTNFLEWQVGAYFTREQGHLYQHVNLMSLPSGAPITALPPLQFATLDSIYKETSGFGNLTVHIIPQFDIQAGGRFSKNEQAVTETISGILATPPQAFSTPSAGHVWTYSVAPRWHIDADNMLYFRWATGYRPGGPNALPPVAPPDVPRSYGADKTNNLELGIKSTLLSGLLSIDAALFHVDWTNIQLLEIVDNNGINGNGGKAKSQGFEWTVGYVPVHGLTLQWTGAYTDAKLTTDAPAVNGVSGDRLPYAPKWGTSLDGEYMAAAFADYKYFVGATWSYVGARSTDFGSDVTQMLQVSLPSYNTYGARVGFDNDRWRWTLYGKNLSDSRGITAYGSGGAPGLNGEVAITQPRTFGVTLSTKF
ncbi:MAG TPA: TonB-dependent receptor plug domain-containing protein [Steroidobacteraceae bacterium]|jgi:outer membrane receptor protein involved in Fe transport